MVILFKCATYCWYLTLQHASNRCLLLKKQSMARYHTTLLASYYISSGSGAGAGSGEEASAIKREVLIGLFSDILSRNLWWSRNGLECESHPSTAPFVDDKNENEDMAHFPLTNLPN